jgi:hypothetical protein
MSELLFGEEHSKFVIGATPIELPYSVLTPGWNEPEEIEDISIITGRRNFNLLWELSQFEVQINLFKYTNAKIFFAAMRGHLGASGVFYPHKDGPALLDSSGNPCSYILTEVNTYSLDGNNIYDIMILTFKCAVPSTLALAVNVIGAEGDILIGGEDFVIGV